MTGDMDGEKSIEIIEQTTTNSGNGIPNMDYIIKAYRILCSKKNCSLCHYNCSHICYVIIAATVVKYENNFHFAKVHRKQICHLQPVSPLNNNNC